MFHRTTRCLAALVPALLLATGAPADTGPALLSGPAHDFELEHESLFLDGQTGAGRDLDLGWHTQRARAGIGQRLRLGQRFTQITLNTDDARLPERMLDLAAAVGGPLSEDGRTGLVVGAGYAGTAPFSDGDALYAEAAITHRLPLSQTSSLRVSLSFNGNRTIFPDVPLPSIAWRHQPRPALTYVIGLPISRIDWRPTPELTLSLAYLLPLNARAEARWQVSDPLELFARFESRWVAAHPDGGPDNRRFLLRQRRVEFGAGYQVTEHLGLEAAGGFAFDQKLDFGWDVRTDNTLARFSDEPYARLGLTLRF